GKPESHHTERKGNYTRVYIGRKNVHLKPGEYTYTLKYKTARQLGFFGDHDELYWNVTGNEWDFPIDRASATVSLPPEVPREQIEVEAYTGPKGAKGGDYTASVTAQAQADFKTTSPLGRREGLTVVVGFPKGAVREPTAGEKLSYILAASGVLVAGLIGLLVVAVYYLVAWARVGRDPAKGVIVPLFAPPEGLSPAACRYVRRMAFDNKCLAAALVNMGVKGHLTIEEDDGDYALLKNDGADEKALSRGETKVARKLFGSRDRLEMDNANHTSFQNAVKGLKQVLKDEHQGRHFHANVKWFVVGVILSVLTVGVVALASFVRDGRPVVAFLSLWLTIWTVAVGALLRQVFATWRAVRGGRKAGGALGITLFAIPFCVAEVIVLGVLVWQTSIWMALVFVLLGLLNAWFHHLLKRPTIEGRRVMDDIEGLRMYMETAERDALEYATSSAPERTPELFERFLPYAIALEVENQWAEKFADVLARAGEGYSPGWYHGRSFTALGAAGLATAVGGSLSGALSSASTAPGSSSGSSGGGSSGGGGGGGGGGGW
ncbi:MAG: DUF2207 domain-containing protein, partial [Planctomycetota bacterium]